MLERLTKGEELVEIEFFGGVEIGVKEATVEAT